jgi:hypothetical protein
MADEEERKRLLEEGRRRVRTMHLIDFTTIWMSYDDLCLFHV